MFFKDSNKLKGFLEFCNLEYVILLGKFQQKIVLLLSILVDWPYNCNGYLSMQVQCVKNLRQAHLSVHGNVMLFYV